MSEPCGACGRGYMPGQITKYCSICGEPDGNPSRGDLLEQIAAIGNGLCAYAGLPWLERRCNCKYGADHIGAHQERGNGCPEMRDIYKRVAKLLESHAS